MFYYNSILPIVNSHQSIDFDSLHLYQKDLNSLNSLHSIHFDNLWTCVERVEKFIDLNQGYMFNTHSIIHWL